MGNSGFFAMGIFSKLLRKIKKAGKGHRWDDGVEMESGDREGVGMLDGSWALVTSACLSMRTEEKADRRDSNWSQWESDLYYFYLLPLPVHDTHYEFYVIIL